MNRISLIIATLGRKDEIIKLFKSIESSRYDLEKLEVIVVDQNPRGFLSEALLSSFRFNVKYIHSNIKGLSINRNIGLAYATGNIICFPDDDCKFYANTFNEVLKVLSDSNTDFCIGRIFNRETEENIIKVWPKKRLTINKLNSYFLASSITVFVKRKFILNFDEKLGVGAEFGSCEDADFIYRLLKNGAKGIYTPNIELWHPSPNYEIISLIKVRNYASGFGYFIRKNTDYVKLLLLTLLLMKKNTQLLLNIYNRSFQKHYFKFFYIGLVKGLIKRP